MHTEPEAGLADQADARQVRPVVEGSRRWIAAANSIRVLVNSFTATAQPLAHGSKARPVRKPLISMSREVTAGVQRAGSQGEDSPRGQGWSSRRTSVCIHHVHSDALKLHVKR